MQSQLAQFEGGASRIILESRLAEFGPAQSDGTAFVIPSSQADELLASTGGDPRALERALGLPEGHLNGDQLVRVDIPNPSELNLRIPSGNEAGANAGWIPGGKLPNGNLEAVVDLGAAPPGRSTVRPVTLQPPGP